MTRAVAFGVLAYLLHWLFLLTPFGYLIVDLSRPLPLTLGG